MSDFKYKKNIIGTRKISRKCIPQCEINNKCHKDLINKKIMTGGLTEPLTPH